MKFTDKQKAQLLELVPDAAVMYALSNSQRMQTLLELTEKTVEEIQRVMAENSGATSITVARLPDELGLIFTDRKYTFQPVTDKNEQYTVIGWGHHETTQYPTKEQVRVAEFKTLGPRDWSGTGSQS